MADEGFVSVGHVESGSDGDVETWLERAKLLEMMRGWHGVDLDGTLAVYDGWRGPDHIGDPVPAMLKRVLDWLEAGDEVRIMTARVCEPDPARRLEVVRVIQEWCLEHVGVALPVTNQKDYGMIDLYDDRVVQIEANTGRRVDGLP